MPRRLLSFLLALLTLWSAFATQELAFDVSSDPIEASLMADPRAQLSDGSIADHHLDDQPVQSHFEGGLIDPHGLIPASCALPRCTLAAAAPHEGRAPPLAAPYLAGLLRPPPGHRQIA